MTPKTPRSSTTTPAVDGAPQPVAADSEAAVPPVPAPPPPPAAQEPPLDSDRPVMSSLVPLRTDTSDVPNPIAGAPENVVDDLYINAVFTPQAIRILRRTARALLVLGAVYIVGWLLLMTGSALMPFVIGLVLAYLLLPVVEWLNKYMPRWAAISLVYVAGLILLIAAIGFIVPPVIDQVRELGSNLPSIDTVIDQSNRLFTQIRSQLPEQIREPLDQGLRRGLTTLQTNLTDYIQNLGSFLINSLLQVVNTLTFLFGFLIVPFWLFYVLNDHKAALQTVDSLLPRVARNDFWAVMRIIDTIFNKYIGGQLFLGLVVGSLVGIGLFVLQLFGLAVPYILLLAIFAGITELVPVIGPVIGAVPAVILAFFVGESPGTTVLAVLILYVGIQQVENQFLVPRIVGESVGIHPAILMVLLIVCSSVFGLLGAILAAPVSAAARDIFTYAYYRLSEPERG